MRRPRFRTLARDNAGGAVLEFAVVGPLFITLILGTLDVGRMFYVRQGLEYATEQGARYLMMNPAATNSTVTTYLRSQMSGGMGSNVAVAYTTTTNCNAAVNVTNNVTCTTITATYPFTFVAGYLGLGSKTLRAVAQAVSY